ncbi:MAG: phosphate ABC transporter permease PstA [Nitrospinaceae bacterium]
MNRSWNQIWKRGDVFVWGAGAILAITLIMLAGLLLSIFLNAAPFFWEDELVQLSLAGGRTVLGEIKEREAVPDPENPAASLKYRIQLKQGNRDLYGTDHIWIDEKNIRNRELPKNALAVERREWGIFFGYLEAVRVDKETLEGGTRGMKVLQDHLPRALETHEKARKIQKQQIGKINFYLEKNRLRLKKLEAGGIASGEAVQQLQNQNREYRKTLKKLESLLGQLRSRETGEAVFRTADGKEKRIPFSKIIRVQTPNRMNLLDRLRFFSIRVWEFIFDDPRESNTEGGIFPAIFGTVMMVLIMTLFATPLGILAALYLREYARQGLWVSAVRIAVNNLAGVPSIVFGVFGVGFFIYFIGGSIDKFFFSESLPAPTFGTGGILWASLTMTLLTVPVVIVSIEEGLAAVPQSIREASLSLGATKFETTWRVVLPAVMPSVLTGLILAMARAAGEVAPLMITGVVKLAPSLPLDDLWPFLHLERKFMHLGFHIYDVGFQSPNVDAARPMVFATTLLLILMVLLLNISAIVLRNRLRRKLSGSAL